MDSYVGAGLMSVDLGISIPRKCVTVLKREAFTTYYKIDRYGDWWWSSVSFENVIIKETWHDSEEYFNYELGYFRDSEWICLYGWLPDTELGIFN